MGGVKTNIDKKKKNYNIYSFMKSHGKSNGAKTIHEVNNSLLAIYLCLIELKESLPDNSKIIDSLKEIDAISRYLSESSGKTVSTG